MIDQGLIKQLNSSATSQRRDAIVALGRSKDRDAIPHLTWIIETDDDPSLVELARQASRYIDKHSPAKPDTKPFKVPWEDEDRIEAAKEAEVTESKRTESLNVEWAENHIDSAWKHFYSRDSKGAEEYLRKAVEIAPTIARTEHFRTAAAKIMKMSPDRAVDVLERVATQSRRPGSMPKKPGTGSLVKENEPIYEANDGHGPSPLLWTGVYAVLHVAVFVVGAAVAADVMRQIGARTPNEFGAFLIDLSRVARTQGVSGLLLPAVVSAMVSTILFVIFSALLHAAARKLGGKATLGRLMRRTANAFVVLLPVYPVLIAWLGNGGTPLWASGAAIGGFIGIPLAYVYEMKQSYRLSTAKSLAAFAVAAGGVGALIAGVLFILSAANISPLSALL